MKPARIIVLVIAVVAGGIAALLAGRQDSPPPTLALRSLADFNSKDKPDADDSGRRGSVNMVRFDVTTTMTTTTK
jgi:Flp pilus assembly protein CpaB